MNNIENALLRLVKIYRQAKKASDVLREIGFGDELLFDLYGLAMDSIYYMVGEEEETFTSSITYRCLHGDYMPDEGCVAMLYDTYKRNMQEPKQPKPNVINREEMQRLYKKYGGYMTPEGDWK